MTLRWLLGDQLGPVYDDGGPIGIIEARSAFTVRPTHRQKAHLLLSAMRHRADELGDRCTYVQAATYGEGLARLREIDPQVEVSHPSSRSALRLAQRYGVSVLPPRGWLTELGEFAGWVATRGSRRLLLEDWYRTVRVTHGLLMAGDAPVGGRWNLDAENRQPPPRTPTLGLPGPAWPTEDEIDASVREDLNAWQEQGTPFLGSDGPRRFAVTREEARSGLMDFVSHRLAAFGPYEDAAMSGDWVMAHSLLSVPLNLGLLHPREAIDAVVAAHDRGAAPLQSVEGFVRQIAGWREYVRHLHWHFGEDYEDENSLDAREPLPEWFAELRADDVRARCLAIALAEVRDRGWTHHILRLMILGNWALQRGYDPRALSEWFIGAFVDGFPWVMAANVIGMSQYADGGRMATKPYAAGGAYISRMTDSCRGCAYRPTERIGERGCPFTAGYWAFLDRAAPALRGNHRMAQPLRGLERLADRKAVIAQEAARGSEPP